MIDLEQDAKAWTQEKLLQISGDIDFLTEKVKKWHSIHFHWELHEEGKTLGLTLSIDKKLLKGECFEEWLGVVYTPLEATILASETVSWECIAPLLNGNFYHKDEISCAINSVDVKMVMPKNGSFADITEPDLGLFNRDVTMLDIVNILDREVASNLYKI